GLGDEVITSAFSFVASASTALMLGARPVFVDIDPVSFNLDPTLVERAVTPRTRAILAVHLYGQPAAMDAIGEISRARGAAAIQGAAEAGGARDRGRTAGPWSRFACTQLLALKEIARRRECRASLSSP